MELLTVLVVYSAGIVGIYTDDEVGMPMAEAAMEKCCSDGGAFVCITRQRLNDSSDSGQLVKWSWQ